MELLKHELRQIECSNFSKTLDNWKTGYESFFNIYFLKLHRHLWKTRHLWTVLKKLTSHKEQNDKKYLYLFKTLYFGKFKTKQGKGTTPVNYLNVLWILKKALIVFSFSFFFFVLNLMKRIYIWPTWFLFSFWVFII